MRSHFHAHKKVPFRSRRYVMYMKPRPYYGRVCWPVRSGFLCACVCLVKMLQALASWRWWNYLEWNGNDTPILKINLDETSVAFNQGGSRGHIFVPCRARGLLKRSIPRATRRRNLTVIAIICNDVEMQPYLPQYIIANKTTFKAKDFASLKVCSLCLWLSCVVVVQAACPDYVTLVR